MVYSVGSTQEIGEETHLFQHDDPIFKYSASLRYNYKQMHSFLVNNLISLDKCICHGTANPGSIKSEHFCHSRKFLCAPSQVTPSDPGIHLLFVTPIFSLKFNTGISKQDFFLITRFYFRAILCYGKLSRQYKGSFYLSPPPPISPIDILHWYGTFVTLDKPILIH